MKAVLKNHISQRYLISLMDKLCSWIRKYLPSHNYLGIRLKVKHDEINLRKQKLDLSNLNENITLS